MQVILLEKIGKLGDLGEQVNVKPGYGRNYLIPNGKAVPATPGNVEKFEAQREELEKVQEEVLTAAQKRAEQLNNLEISLLRRIVSEDKLFGSVGITDIVTAAAEAGHEITKHEVRLSDGPFRTLGEYEVELHLHADVNAVIKLNIGAEQGSDAN